ncbi:MAG TPA: ATP-binding protein [Kiloniellales bacterium]|jgi:serine/threonine-protein kinase RsbW|nr:ATP-binding protein [Kiloniellales bacterium]
MIATESSLELVLRNDLAELDRLAAAVEDFCADQGVPMQAAYHLNLVLDELVTNIVSYGYDEGSGEREIRISLKREPAAVQVGVEDDGRPFNPLEVAQPDVDAPVETRPIGGLGVHFLRTLMDELCYRRENERNKLCFKKPLPQDGAAA